MLKHLRETKWAALAAMLLLLGQPALGQKYRLSPQEEAALDEAASAVEEAVADLDGPALPSAPARPRATRPQPDPRPALWLLQDADTKIYLFGTVHILPPGFRWRWSAVDDAIRQADELVLEISDREMMTDPAGLTGEMMLGKQAPLAWRVSPERREALARMLDELGLPAFMMDSMHTWAAALTIIAIATVRGLGTEGEEEVNISEMPGVEEGLETEFRALGRPISGVETVAQQLGFFGSLSFAQQRELLESMIDDYSREGISRESPDMLGEWVRGNPDGVTIYAEDMPGMLYDVLITRRNRAWTDWLVARLEQPGTVLFAVGAGHLAGPDSVQTMLAGRGLAVTRIH